MVTDVETTHDDTDLVYLSTKNCTVRIPRSSLKSSSFFFKAAFQSGMSEAQSGKFSLPDFSARQLQHLSNFLYDFDLLTANLCAKDMKSDKDSPSGEELKNNCQCEEEMRRIVEATFVADYLQMPSFKAKLVDLFSKLLHSNHSSSFRCSSPSHPCNMLTYSFSILFDSRLHCLKKTLLSFLYRFPFTYLNPKYVHVDISLSSVTSQISRCLSDDRMSIGSEDNILNTISDWIQLPDHLKKRRLDTDSISTVLSALSPAIRLGLLSPAGMNYFLSLSKDNLNDSGFSLDLKSKIIAVRRLLAYNFTSSFQSMLCYSTIEKDLVISLGENAFKPRASSPILLILSKSSYRSSDIFFYFVDLVNGRFLTSNLPPLLTSTLLSDPIESNPIHICTAEVNTCQNLVFICIHQINTATIIGFIWDLSTLNAEWLPLLHLKHDSFAWAAKHLPTTFSLPHNVGIVYTSDGLVVFCSFIVASDAVLCVYRFDARMWSWVKFTPYKFDLNLHQPGIKGFTPMPKATRRGDQWLYGTLDISSGSKFIRAKPKNHESNTIEVEHLPSPDFLLRACCLVGVDLTLENSELTKSYILPFHACSRDSLALSTCFCLASGTWSHWNPIESTISPSEDDVSFAFSRRHIGFRGIVCTSSLTWRLPILSGDSQNCEDSLCTTDSCSSPVLSRSDLTFSSTDPSLSRSFSFSPPLITSNHYEIRSHNLTSSSHDLNCFSSKLLIAGTFVVMAGCLAQSADIKEPRASGIWLIDPRYQSVGPAFPLPTELDFFLNHADTAVATVALANWSAITRAVDNHETSASIINFNSLYQKNMRSSESCSIPPGAGSDSD